MHLSFLSMTFGLFSVFEINIATKRFQYLNKASPKRKSHCWVFRIVIADFSSVGQSCKHLVGLVQEKIFHEITYCWVKLNKKPVVIFVVSIAPSSQSQWLLMLKDITFSMYMISDVPLCFPHSPHFLSLFLLTFFSRYSTHSSSILNINNFLSISLIASFC